MPHLVSPNELMALARIHMLGGKEPETHRDYERVINFIAANLESEIALSACLLMRVLYDMPLSEGGITAIVDYQNDHRIRPHNFYYDGIGDPNRCVFTEHNGEQCGITKQAHGVYPELRKHDRP